MISARAPSAMSASASSEGQAGLAGRGRAGDDDERRYVAAVAVRPSRPVSAYGSGEGSAERVAARQRRCARYEEPSRARGRPARWTSLSGERPAGGVRARGPPSSWSWLAGRRRSCRPAPRQSRPSQARFRSSPIALLDIEQRVEPAPLVGRRHVIGEMCRGRPRSRGERGREDLVVAEGPEQVERRLELGLGLAAEPHDHVGRDRDPGHRRTDRGEPLAVVLDRVLAAHPMEDGVVARLDRQVEVLADATGTPPGPRSRRSDRSHGCEVTKRRRGMAGRPSAVRSPSMARISSARSGPAEEVEAAAGPALGGDVGEPFLGRQVVAVRVHVLAEQRHLAVAGARQRPRLGDHLVERAAALRAAAERDDAVRAGLVAAVDDRQPGAGRARRGGSSAPPRPRARVEGRWSAAPTTVRPTTVVIAGRGLRAEPDRALRRGQAEPVDELGLLVRPQEEVDRREAARQAGPVALADGAAGQHDPQRRVGDLELRQLALPADDLLLGRLADRAGVDDDEVGGLDRRAPRRSRPRAGGPPSPRSRCGSSGSRASRRGSSAGRRPRGGTPSTRASAAAAGPRRRHGARRQDVEHGQRAGGRAVRIIGRSMSPRASARRVGGRPIAARTASASAVGTQSRGVRLGVRLPVAMVVAASRGGRVRAGSPRPPPPHGPGRSGGSGPRSRPGPISRSSRRTGCRSAASAEWARTGARRPPGSPGSRRAARPPSRGTYAGPAGADDPVEGVLDALGVGPRATSARASVGRPRASSSSCRSTVGELVDRHAELAQARDHPLERDPARLALARRGAASKPSSSGSTPKPEDVELALASAAADAVGHGVDLDPRDQLEAGGIAPAGGAARGSRRACRGR